MQASVSKLITKQTSICKLISKQTSVSKLATKHASINSSASRRTSMINRPATGIPERLMMMMMVTATQKHLRLPSIFTAAAAVLKVNRIPQNRREISVNGRNTTAIRTQYERQFIDDVGRDSSRGTLKKIVRMRMLSPAIQFYFQVDVVLLALISLHLKQVSEQIQGADVGVDLRHEEAVERLDGHGRK